jgi:hypothetical protein
VRKNDLRKGTKMHSSFCRNPISFALTLLAVLTAWLLSAAPARGGLLVEPVSFSQTVMAGINPDADNLCLANASTVGTVHYGAAVTAGGEWFTLGESAQGALSPGETGVLAVVYNAADLDPGQYNGTILLTNAVVEPGMTNFGPPRELPVRLLVNPRPELCVSTNLISNTVSEGEDAPPRIFQVWNGSGYYTLTYTISDNALWVIPDVTSGTCTTEHDVITLEYSTAGLAQGSYTGLLTVTASEPVGEVKSRDIVLRLNVTGLAGLGCDGKEQTYNLRQGSGAVTGSFKVWNTVSSAGTSLRWNTTVLPEQTPWLTVSPSAGEVAAGSAPQKVVVRCNPKEKKPGSYRALVRVSGVDTLTGRAARGSPYDIYIGMVVRTSDRLYFGGDYGSALIVYGQETGNWGLGNLSGEQYWTWFGGEGYVPVPGDYDGDGIAELGVYRASSGGWYWRKLGSENIFMLGNWGGPGYRPIQGDFDGDGLQDFVLYHEGMGQWYALLSTYGFQGGVQINFGGPGCIAMHGDFDGDGKADPAVYHPASGTWHGLASSLNYRYLHGPFGGPEYTGLTGDFNGDGHTDLCLYHVSGRWYILSVGGKLLLNGDWWGGPGWTPVVADYDGDGADDLAIYDKPSGRWRIRRRDGTIIAWDIRLGGGVYDAVGK